ncbi:fumarate reductase/succinate dehydrogenase [Grosmannia clavigera kw1407]|uniref:Fumarate reductase/succinate dehydrogenase n=1 Tax=Grosmannia clavigera (strain kw1407 / UAMH 11150) TaxID=655863 RepID=F0XB19_GROCL|nr:fumarate reductase/succinate dehydrogenase [Grosmannia clavigera kw1407]EFX04831.1 fumarate reductase/succinate dehydrogenase [Grosmannia clavigera kw1407]
MGHPKNVLADVLLAAAGGNAVCTPNLTQMYPNATVKTVDIVVVGGGDAGANAASNLYDAGLSVIVLEKEDHLGGRVNGWTNPSTNVNYDYDVATYTNYTGTEAFFERLGINITTPTFLTTTSSYVDFSTGETIAYDAANFTTELVALQKYYDVANNYSDYYLPSYANWPAPEDIPEDLLMSFRDFAIKYELNTTMLLIWAGIGAGLADMLDALALYVMQTFDPQTAAVFLGYDVQYVPTSGRNQDIYNTIASILGDSVMVNTTVVSSSRLADKGGVQLAVKNFVTGKVAVIKVKRLVMAIEPTTDNTAPFNLDTKESAVFDNATWSVVHAGIVSHFSLPTNGLVYNLPASAAKGNAFSYPEPPFVDYLEYIGEDLWQVIAAGWVGFSVEDAQNLANEALQMMAAAGTIPATNGTNLTIQAWSDYGAMDMRTSAKNLKACFIQQQYSLQGYRSTYWTGGAFSNQLSTYMWAYNKEYLVPLVVASL